MLKKPLVLIYGTSGAGVGTAVKAFEDLDFLCIDNLPFEMLLPNLNFLNKRCESYSGLAIGLHIRESHELTLLAQSKNLSAFRDKFLLDIIFLKASSEVLVSRYLTLRRKHPLVEVGVSLMSAIEKQQDFFLLHESLAYQVIDTSLLSPYELSKKLESSYATSATKRRMNISIVSFGFKRGLVSSIDSLFDVRCFTNPFFDVKLRSQTGKDKEVIAFLRSKKDVTEFEAKLLDLVNWMLPKYFQEGKRFFKIAIGCTGGKHRSVFFAESLYNHLKNKDQSKYILSLFHRDVEYE